MNGKSWFESQFPEAIFPCHETLLKEYSNRIARGIYIMSGTTAQIVTNLGNDAHLARLDKLGQFFRDYQVHLLAKRIPDTAEDILMQYPKFQFWDVENTEYDYYINIDNELLGGFSYEGIANSFGWLEIWDRIGSNGLYIQRDGKIIFKDWYNYRRLGHWEKHNQNEVESLSYQRGEPPIRVYACHGGLTISKRHCMYSTPKEMLANGKTCWLNPSMITLYSETLYKIP